MRALVVYESMFGNTGVVARAIATGLQQEYEVEVVGVDRAPGTIGDADLVVVGAPTHAFGMSNRRTRWEAREMGATGTGRERGVRDWLELLDRVPQHVHAAAFDTRVRRHLLHGSAARAVQRRLRRRGFTTAADPMTFWVTSTHGPLIAGEEERARLWGARLASGAPLRWD